MKAEIAKYLHRLITDIASVDSDLVTLTIIIVCGVIVLDAVLSQMNRKVVSTGVNKEAKTVSIDGSKTLPVREYISEMQGLAGRPDALISEDGYIIPVERKPLARKIRDRYVAQLLVYMRLIEEFEGTKPPYGYLILGANCRKIKIENSEARQAWLQKMLDEMNSILAGQSDSIPAPSAPKCAKCNMRASCAHRVDEVPPAQIRRRA